MKKLGRLAVQLCRSRSFKGGGIGSFSLSRIADTKRVLFAFITLLAAGCVAAASTSPAPKVDERLLAAERKLSSLGYWVLKVDGVADSSTRHAIMAFQKVNGSKRTGILSDGLLEDLNFASSPAARYNTGKVHVEVDITRQILFLVDESGTVSRILPVSTGNEKRYFDEGKWQVAHTPRGAFKITRQIKGVRKAPLGDLYNPNYFQGGVAIHGSNSIPPYPASHGCIRIPRFADRAFSELVEVGTDVFVYD